MVKMLLMGRIINMHNYELENRIYLKNEVVKLCNQVLEILGDYENEYIYELKNNIHLIEDVNVGFISKTIGKNVFLFDLFDFVSYKITFRNEDISDEKIMPVLIIKDNEDGKLERNGITYKWSLRKDYLNKLRHNVKLEEAISIIENSTEKYSTYKNRKEVFGIYKDSIFVVIECEYLEGKVIRIISFRESNEDEWEEAKNANKRNG